MEALGPLVGENLGVERAPIEIREEGLRHSVKIGNAVDFEIEGDRKSSLDRMHGDMVNREGAVARDHHHPFEYGLVVECAWLSGHRHLGGGTVGAHRLDDAVLERGHAVERQRAADCNDKVDEQHLAYLPHAQPFDPDDAGNASDGGADFVGGSGRGGIGQRVDGAPAEPPAGDANHHRHGHGRYRVGPRIAEGDPK